MSWFQRLYLLFAVVYVVSTYADDQIFRVTHSMEDLVTSVERARHVSAVLLLSSKGDAKFHEFMSKNDGLDNDEGLIKVLEAQFPHVGKIASSLDGVVEFVVADLPDSKAILKKWNIASLPALVIYKDTPKTNPYTGELYRDATLVPVGVLQKPRELKKLLRESIPSTYVTEWTTLDGITTLDDIQAQRPAKEALVILVSKQTTASPLFRALSVEFASRGLAFAYVNHDEAVAQELVDKWAIDKLPAIVVVKSTESLDDRVVFQDDSNMKKYGDLKSLLEPFATTSEKTATGTEGDGIKTTTTELPFLTASTFDKQVLESKLVWIVSFMDAETEATTDTKEWKKLMSDVQKKSGIVGVGAVSCAKDAVLCEKYGGAGVVRIFPIQHDVATGEIDRADVIEEVFKSVDQAKQPAIDSIPDVVKVMGSAVEVNAFISRAMADNAMPVLLVTNKLETPPILKSLALSFPTQNVAVGVVSDLDPQVKQVLNLPASSKSSFLSLIAVDKQKVQAENQPPNAAPYGVILYDKKMMGPFTYPNMVRYLMSILTQYPHPKTLPTADEPGVEFASGGDESTGTDVDVPYLRADSLEALCSGNKICAIGFFDGHIDTLSVENSPLAKAVDVLSHVAAKAKKSRQPFHFMWTNGKCQSAFAESFGVGAFQMPTVVVYSPSKARYATNIGVFDEDNTAGFLRGVLAGKIATAPLKETVAALRDECTIEEVSDSVDGGELADESDDLGDLLSEILGDEEEQRRKLQAELAKERKTTKKESGKKDKKKKKKKSGKGKKKNGDDRDEL